MWLIAPHSDIKQIHYLKHGFYPFKKDGYQLYDFENGLSEKLYDYISNPLNYRTEEGMLFLYLGEKMFRMNEDKSIQLVEIPNMDLFIWTGIHFGEKIWNILFPFITVGKTLQAVILNNSWTQKPLKNGF